MTRQLSQSTSHCTDEETEGSDRGRDMPKSCVAGDSAMIRTQASAFEIKGPEMRPKGAEFVVRSDWDAVPTLLLTAV